MPSLRELTRPCRPGDWRAFDWRHRELIAGRAEIGKKVEVVFNGMRLTTDQAHQTAAKLTMNWCRRRLLFQEDDLVHDADAKASVTTVNSVSLQPMLARRQALAFSNHFAWLATQQDPEAFEPFAVHMPLVATPSNE